MTLPGRHVRAAATLAAILAFALLSHGCATIDPPGTYVYEYREDSGLAGLPTTNSAATRAYIRGLTFATTPIVQVVSCHDNSATIFIFPEVRSHYLNSQHARYRGRIVAWIRNAGKTNCRDLHLAPGEVAYWWMGPSRSGDTLTTDFWRIPPTQGDTLYHLANAGGTRLYKEGQRSIWDATISTTPHHLTGHDDSETEFPFFGHNSTWIACLDGCCESTSLVDGFYPPGT